MKTVFLLPVFLILSHGLKSQTIRQPADSFSFPAPLSFDSLVKKQLWATQYYIHSFRSSGSIPILDANNKPLGFYADTCDFCTAALEGTAYVTDSAGQIHVINYSKTGKRMLVNCRSCNKYRNSKASVESWGRTLWKISSGYGEGVRGYRLVPFRTVAVDPDIIPYGTVIYIPEARGDTIQFNDTVKFVHDGYFFAGDTGGAIHHNHIDVFTGGCAANPFANFVYSTPKKTFSAYIIKDTAIVQPITFIHLPAKE